MLKKSDYNIEFAHIYINENFANEHRQASKIAKNKLQDLAKQNKTGILTVLIDDYNPSDSILNVDEFLEKLNKLGAKPDYMVYESKLASYKDIILKEMNGKIKNKYEKYIYNHSKCPCSFLIAVWHLVRLGFLNANPMIEHLGKKPFIAEKIITILPQRYAEIEKKL